jgi:hypothetical protein
VEDARFDGLARALSEGASRRRVLGSLAGLAGLGLGEAAAKGHGKSGKKRGKSKGRVDAAGAKDHKVTICHHDAESDTYKKISVDEHAVQKHIDNHGDFLFDDCCADTDCGDDESCNRGACKSKCTADGNTCNANAACCSGVCTCGSNDEAGHCQGDFEQGFEQDSNGWQDVNRVASGTDSIDAKSGDYYATVAPNGGAVTHWGGYSSAFPTGGYDTELSIYLDPDANPGNGQFDYSSAVSGPDCAHRRDFIFTGGRSGGSDFCVSASNNSPGWPCNPGREPVVLTEPGWYTFRHEFREANGNVLSVDMVLLGPDGNELNTWTLSDPSDVIGGTVGGNRYGWFVDNDFALAIDDTSRTS